MKRMQREKDADQDRTGRALRRQRWQLVARLHRLLDPAFVVLSAIWLILVVIELATGGLPRALEILVWVIWGLFVAEFLTGLLIAPARSVYLRKRWLTALSLVLPAFRIIRVASLLRFVSAAQLRALSGCCACSLPSTEVSRHSARRRAAAALPMWSQPRG